MNEIRYQIDHDFRNLTKLVWHFYDFSMIYYEFPSIQPIIKITKTPKKKTKDPWAQSSPARPGPAAKAAQTGGACARA